MTLVEFLFARIADDLAKVEGIYQGDDPDFFWGPDRIRSECAVKLALIGDISENYLDHPGGVGSTDGLAARVLLYLVAQYADHPEFDASWVETDTP